MNIFIITYHSFIDLITNSSTQVYVSVRERAIATLHELVNNVLALDESTLKSEDLFNIEIVYLIETIQENGDYQELLLTESEIKQAVIDGTVHEDDAGRALDPENYDRYRANQLRVTCKVLNPQTIRIAEIIEHLRGLFGIEARYN